MQIKKSSSASLENQKVIYVLMGFVFVLSLCYVALEWTQHEITKYEQADMDFLIEEEIEIQQTSQDNTPPPPPPPEAPEIIQDLDNLNVVENDVEVESTIQIVEEEEVHIQAAEPVIEEVKEEVKEVVKEEKKEEEDENVVFKIVEQQAEFPGGDAARVKFLSENVRYPAVAQESGIQGRAICQFTVNKDGSICDIVVVRSSGDDSLDKEAVRVIKSMPNWVPGKQRGKPVRSMFTLPITFKLQ